MARILLVEDDEKLRKELKIFLQRNGYEADEIEDFEKVIEEVISKNPDLLLLDVNLPVTDGEYLCKEIRKFSEVPIIMITSKNTELDELISLNYGADDFVSKPFNVQILLAKINAILKRVNRMNTNSYKTENFTLDVSKSILLREEGNKQFSVELTKNELKILSFLLQKRGEIVSRDEIMDYLWDSQMFVDDNTLTVNMNRLRKKLEDIGLENQIETKRGQGYLLV